MDKSRSRQRVRPSVVRRFFELLKGGLWENYTPKWELFTFSDDRRWTELFVLAKEQTVAALMWDGIAKLPEIYQPSRKQQMAWFSYVVQVENSNRMVNRRLVEIVEIYEKRGLHPILLKGQGLALLYHNPLHRQCGDIDLYFAGDDFEKANLIGLEIGNTPLEMSHKHCSFDFNGVHIENHRHVATLHNLSHRELFNRRVDVAVGQQNTKVVIEGKEIPILPPALNVEFVFQHLYHHFVASGISFRQICDWLRLLDTHPMDGSNVAGNRKPWALFGTIGVEYLGFPARKMPLYRKGSAGKAEEIIQMILADGNFGHNDTARMTDRPGGYYQGKLFTLRRMVKRTLRLFKLFPIDALEYLFVYQLPLSLKAIAKDKFDVGANQ